MKKRNRFRNYISLEAVVIFLVLLTFRVVPDKKLASVITSIFFIGSSVGIMIWEMKYPGYKKRISFWGCAGFLLLSAIPIFLMRILNWNLSFEEIQFAGISGAEMHKLSTYVFFLLMVCFFVDSYLERLKEKDQESQV
jgi:hypothetical protein